MSSLSCGSGGWILGIKMIKLQISENVKWETRKKKRNGAAAAEGKGKKKTISPRNLIARKVLFQWRMFT